MNEHRSGFVSIIGRPNVGKSTLLNQLVGHKVAIISPKPQTTRNRIRGIFTGHNFQIIFIDTPGIHKPKHKLGEYMVEVAERTLKGMDIILHVIDGSAVLGPGEEYVLQRLKLVTIPVFLIVNKIDTISPEALGGVIARMTERFEYKEVVPVSALTGENVPRLREVLVQYLPPGPRYYPEEVVTDQPERLVIAELIREKVLGLTREEVPHATAVEVSEMEVRPNGVLYIAASVFVERDSQKAIIIGKGGQMLKEIGRLAREEIEGVFGQKVYLELTVKVKKDWRKQEAYLRYFGYSLTD